MALSSMTLSMIKIKYHNTRPSILRLSFNIMTLSIMTFCTVALSITMQSTMGLIASLSTMKLSITMLSIMGTIVSFSINTTQNNSTQNNDTYENDPQHNYAQQNVWLIASIFKNGYAE